MFRYFFKSKEWRLWAYGGGAFLLSSIWIQVQFTVWLNKWYGGFYDLFSNAEDYYGTGDGSFWSNEGIQIFLQKLLSFDFLFTFNFDDISFVTLVIPWILIDAFTFWFGRIYVLRWREAMTFGYIPRWLRVEEEIEGASQRIQEDIQKFSYIVERLGLRAVSAILTLIAFIPLLWELSSKVNLPIFRDYEGSLVWAALIVSIGGLVISWFVGIKLPGLEYDIQKKEAAFRKELVYGEDDKTNYASFPVLFELFTGVRVKQERLILHYTYFDVWLSFFNQIMSILPYLVIGPAMFISSAVLMGTLVQVSNAFGKVQGNLSFLTNSWTTITELRSIHKRLTEFEQNLDRYEKPQEAYAD